MVLAAVDDLMFMSKIATAAKGAGVELIFVRSPEELVAKVRANAPDLVIFDLNSARLQPLATIAALKADASLASVRTLGFVSHVQGDLIAQARATGIDEVLARSAFTARLLEILKGRTT